jgi:DNA/RNA-binding domain of Phe-tRNA-synthetase-like protein
MLQIKFDAEFEKLGLGFGLFWFTCKVTVQDDIPELDLVFDQVCTTVSEDLEGKQVTDLPELQATRTFLKQLKIDPAKHRAAQERLLRRITRSMPLPRVNTVVDICNIISIKHRIPLGLYDIVSIEGDNIIFGVCKDDAEFEAVAGGSVHALGKPLLHDAKGPFGGPIYDSARTRVEVKTKSILAVLFCPAGINHLNAQNEWVQMLAKFAQASNYNYGFSRSSTI